MDLLQLRTRMLFRAQRCFGGKLIVCQKVALIAVATASDRFLRW